MTKAIVKMLASTRTRSETGFEKILSDIETCTVYGGQRKKQLKPFLPGQEELLQREYDHTDVLCRIVQSHPGFADEMIACLWQIKEIGLTLSRSLSQTLSVVELFDIKTFLLRTSDLRRMLEQEAGPAPEDYRLRDTDPLLDRLDPSGERIDTFYIYDAFSPVLAELRKEKSSWSWRASQDPEGDPFQSGESLGFPDDAQMRASCAESRQSLDRTGRRTSSAL